MEKTKKEKTDVNTEDQPSCCPVTRKLSQFLAAGGFHASLEVLFQKYSEVLGENLDLHKNKMGIGTE